MRTLIDVLVGLCPFVFFGVGLWVFVKRDTRLGALMTFGGLGLIATLIVALTTK